MLGLQFWQVPIVAAVIWTAMLVTMLSYYYAIGAPHYVSMREGQTIPYISDIGADKLKPLFISMGTASVVIFDLAFISERWLRHSGRLTRNTSTWQKVCSTLATIAALVGAAGLIFLSIRDVKNHKREHDLGLGIFIIGYVFSAIFICAEYQRLGIHYRQHSILRASFWIKLFFILAEIALAIGFGVTSHIGKFNAAAALEWTVAFIYGLYVVSFALDFLPALKTRHGKNFQETEMQAAEEGENTTRDF